MSLFFLLIHSGHEVCGKVTLKHIYEISKLKQQDPPLRFKTLEHICRNTIGAALSIGIEACFFICKANKPRM